MLAWVLQGLAALAFIGSGANKLAHLSETSSNFSHLGLPGWFAYLVAGGEVLSAAYMHATKIPGGLLPHGFPSLVLLAALALLLVLRRPQPATA